jgi:hypothetical protein
MGKSRFKWAIAICVTCGVAGAQQDLRPKKDEVELPLPITSPRAVKPGTIEPLSPRDKAVRALRNTVAPQALANRALLAGFSQLWDSPEEWSGDIKGYGQRFASRMGHLAVRQSIQLSTDVAFGLDPRYDRCECDRFWDRTKHAWRRVLVARKDNGGEMISVTHLSAAFIPPMITDQWYPARYQTWGHKFSSGAEFLAFRGVTNMLREFWPEIGRKARLQRFRRLD